MKSLKEIHLQKKGLFYYYYLYSRDFHRWLLKRSDNDNFVSIFLHQTKKNNHGKCFIISKFCSIDFGKIQKKFIKFEQFIIVLSDCLPKTNKIQTGCQKSCLSICNCICNRYVAFIIRKLIYFRYIWEWFHKSFNLLLFAVQRRYITSIARKAIEYFFELFQDFHSAFPKDTYIF